MVRPRILIASPSRYRREWYRTELESHGMDVHVVEGGTDCVNVLFTMQPDAVVLESGLKWGGADGVLSILNANSELMGIPVILIAADGNSSEIYHLARFSFQGFFSHVPLADELAKSIQQAIDDSKSISLSMAT